MKDKRTLVFSIFINSIIFIFIFPLIILVIWSFTNEWIWPSLFPTKLGLRGFISIFNVSTGIFKILFSSVLLSFIVTFFTLILSFPAAKSIGIYNFKGKKLVEMLIMSPLIIPTVALGTGVHVFFIKLGLANTVVGVVIIQMIPCMPYGIRILSDVYKTIGNKYELQARVLGATTLKTFINVTLPLTAPGIISAASLVFVVSFSQYFLTLLIGGGSIVTLSTVMFPLIQNGDRTLGAVYSSIFILVTFIFLCVIEKVVRSYYKIDNHLYL